MKGVGALVLFFSLGVAAGGSPEPTELLGPTPYKSLADSPLTIPDGGTFRLEDFEDGLFNVPGVRASASVVCSTVPNNPALIDSVDGDDGNPLNGSCPGCDCLYNPQGFAGIRFTFDPLGQAGLPTRAGAVWTDGDGLTGFEAFDEAGRSLGIVGPLALADETFFGTTGEDRFFGVIHEGGVSAIRIWNTVGGVEVDHLQFGWLVSCSDSDADGFGSPGSLACALGEAEDCDDEDPEISPDEVELLDGVDNNCNGARDEGFDDDGDGIPNFNDACNSPTPGVGVGPDGCAVCSPDFDGDGFQVGADCDDGDAAVHPGAPETCNLQDDDCDVLVDEGLDIDADGHTPCSGDCNDADAGVRPGAVDLPGNTVDENCDGSLGPCDPGGPWASHGEYVSCVTHECEALVASGAVTPEVCEALVNQAGRSRERR